MWPRDSRGHRLACVAVGACLLLVLFSGGSQASTGRVADERPMVAPATAPGTEVALHPMPKALDDMTCAQCYAAPGPAADGVSAESGLRETTARQERTTSVDDTTLFKDTGGWRQRLPVRIAFCRWLD